jgi:hypothetical protein
LRAGEAEMYREAAAFAMHLACVEVG